MMANRFSGMTIGQILALKKASVRNAPMPAGSPRWEVILELTWEQVDDKARANEPGFKMIRKLLSDSRFDR